MSWELFAPLLFRKVVATFCAVFTSTGWAKTDMEKSVVNGNPVESYKLSEDALKTLTENLRELQDVEIDVDITTVKFEQFEKIDGDPRYDALSPAELRAMEFMIEE